MSKPVARRESRGGVIPFRKAASSSPLDPYRLSGWVVPEGLTAAEESWVASQLAMARVSARSLTAQQGRTLMSAIQRFLAEHGLRSVEPEMVQLAVEAVSRGGMTSAQAVEDLWRRAGAAYPEWTRAPDALVAQVAQTWQQAALTNAQALVANPAIQTWMARRGANPINILAALGGDPDPKALVAKPNPRQIPAYRQDAMSLVQDLDKGTKAAIQRLIERGLREGRNPLDVARDIRTVNGFGLTEQQSMAVYNYQQALRDGNWEAATDRSLHDLRFKQPETATGVERLTERYSERMAAYRANTIARTEMMRAANRGAAEVWEQMAADGVVRRGELKRFWAVAPENATSAKIGHKPVQLGPCERCAITASLNAEGVGMDEPFITDNADPIDIPPLHPNCRCVVIYRPAFLSLKERAELAVEMGFTE